MDCLDLAFALALKSVDSAAKWSSRVRPPRPRPSPATRDGAIAVLIPERGTPDLLGECLDALQLALENVVAPAEVFVVINGHGLMDYRELVARHTGIHWIHEPRPLGFGGAIARGLADVRQDWVYLLNSDMTVAPDAISSLLPLRDAYTFAIASQLFFADPLRRREETGWTDYAVRAGLTEHFDRDPEGPEIRGHLYAGGGASLFRSSLLRRFVATTAAYHPFYFEDADWGLQAARCGMRVKYCPQSRAWHKHRATISRYYEAREIARIIRRNEILFEARHGLGGRVRLLRGEPRRTRREMVTLSCLCSMLRQRWLTDRAVASGFAPALLSATYYSPCPSRAPIPPRVITGLPQAGKLRGSRRTPAMGLQGHSRLMLCADEGDIVRLVVHDPDHPEFAIHTIASPANARISTDNDGQRSARLPRIAKQISWWERVYGTSVR